MNLVHLVIICLSLVVQILFPNPYTFGQIGNTTGIVTPDNNTNTVGTSNDSGIMQNTSGIIDDAFNALKDSFGSFFGK
ncbi:MAG TPA: hypothetical protein VIA08_03020 [Nitrososphaeraceae archaeon]|jgi:hypothetical protein